MSTQNSSQTKTVLVTFASKHGSTKEIAEAIAGQLKVTGVSVDIHNVSNVKTLSQYDTIVLGSAVYAGKWRPSAKKFVDTYSKQLRTKQVWLFSSGPIGETPKPVPEKSVDIADIKGRVIPHDHKVFTGRLNKKKLSLGERALITAMRVKPGDYRDWDEINAWANKIAKAEV